MTRATPKRPGNVAVVFALCLVTLCSLLALSLDGGLVMDSRRNAQSAADAAAIAAADDLYQNWPTYAGYDTPAGAAATAARATAKAMGYEHGVNGCTVEVYVPPKTGPFQDMPGHAEVIITAARDRTFSKLWSSDQVKYGARAVARGRWSVIKKAIIVLDPNGKGALNAGGNGTVTVQNAPIQVNSSDSSAMIGNGNGSLTAGEFDVSGSPGYTTPGGGSFTGPIVSPSPALADPLAYLAQPVASDYTLQSSKKLTLSGGGKKSAVTLDPGLYVGGIQITGGTVTLNPGVYYLEDGGLSVSGSGSLVGAGVMLYNDPSSNSDTITLAGSGNSITLSPMLTGPYAGITLFQNRTTTAPVTVSGSSTTVLSMTGTFYAAAATLAVTGNGVQQTLGSQYISYDLVTGGNGSYVVTWAENLSPGTREILLVE
jgi:Putative Flp pilus-assembly TadE/G-like